MPSSTSTTTLSTAAPSSSSTPPPKPFVAEASEPVPPLPRTAEVGAALEEREGVDLPPCRRRVATGTTQTWSRTLGRWRSTTPETRRRRRGPNMGSGRREGREEGGVGREGVQGVDEVERGAVGRASREFGPSQERHSRARRGRARRSSRARGARLRSIRLDRGCNFARGGLSCAHFFFCSGLETYSVGQTLGDVLPDFPDQLGEWPNPVDLQETWGMLSSTKDCRGFAPLGDMGSAPRATRRRARGGAGPSWTCCAAGRETRYSQPLAPQTEVECIQPRTFRRLLGPSKVTTVFSRDATEAKKHRDDRGVGILRRGKARI